MEIQLCHHRNKLLFEIYLKKKVFLYIYTIIYNIIKFSFKNIKHPEVLNSMCAYIKRGYAVLRIILYLTGDLWPIPEVSCTRHPIFALGCILINIFSEVLEPCRHLKRKQAFNNCT